MLAFLFLWRGHIAVQCRVYVYEKEADASANERNLHGHQRHHPTSCSWRVSLRSQILLSLKGIWVAEVCLLSHEQGQGNLGRGMCAGQDRGGTAKKLN